MKINREELLKVLAAIKPGLTSKESIEQGTHFIFGDGEVYSYNDKISISHEIDLEIGTFAIPGEEFFQVLSKLKEDEVDLEVKDDKLQIKSGKTKASIVIDSEIRIPEIAIPEEWNDLPGNFSEAVKFCLFSVGKNMTKLALTCVQVLSDQVRSCDNHRLTFYNLSSSIPSFGEQLLIPGTAAEQLIKYDPIEYAEDGSWLHFGNEAGIIFSCRTVDVKYPDLSDLVKVEGVDIKLPESIGDAIDKAGILAVQEFEFDRHISLILSKNKLIVKGEGKLGWLEEEIKIDYKGEKTTLKVHPAHFIDILKLLNKAVVGENSMLFSGEDFVHVISLVQ